MFCFQSGGEYVDNGDGTYTLEKAYGPALELIPNSGSQMVEPLFGEHDNSGRPFTLSAFGSIQQAVGELKESYFGGPLILGQGATDGWGFVVLGYVDYYGKFGICVAVAGPDGVNASGMWGYSDSGKYTSGQTFEIRCTYLLDGGTTPYCKAALYDANGVQIPYAVSGVQPASGSDFGVAPAGMGVASPRYTSTNDTKNTYYVSNLRLTYASDKPPAGAQLVRGIGGL